MLCELPPGKGRDNLGNETGHGTCGNADLSGSKNTI